MITLRVSGNELAAIKSYAKLHGKTVSDTVRAAILEKIEDEFDAKIAEQAYAEWINDSKKTFSLDEVQKELGLK